MVGFFVFELSPIWTHLLLGHDRCSTFPESTIFEETRLDPFRQRSVSVSFPFAWPSIKVHVSTTSSQPQLDAECMNYERWKPVRVVHHECLLIFIIYLHSQECGFLMIFFGQLSHHPSLLQGVSSLHVSIEREYTCKCWRGVPWYERIKRWIVDLTERQDTTLEDKFRDCLD